MSQQKVIRMGPCPRCRAEGGDKKGNNLAYYDDGHTFCFGGHGVVDYSSNSNRSKGKNGLITEDYSYMSEEATQENTLVYNPNEYQDSRDVNAKYFEMYKVQVNDDKHVYPIVSKDDFSTLKGLQTRFLKNKTFYSEGDTVNQALFGAHVWPKGSSKDILVTEGPLDAISACQMLNGSVACVSFQNCTSAKKQAQLNFDYLNSFNSIYYCPDNDKPGLEVLKEIGPLFGGKLKVVSLPSKYKDANDALKGGDYALFNRLKGNAHLWVPDGIVRSDSTLPRLLTYKQKIKNSIPYPWEGLNEHLCGIRQGELITICSGTGQGKSSVLRELLYYLLIKTDDEIGALFLEESLEKTEFHLIGIDLQRPIHLPTSSYTDEELTNSYNKLLASGRVFHHDHFGSTQVDNIISKIKYMAKVANCKFVFLDHISIVVSSQENGDERKAIDEIMTKLRTLVEETGITVFLVTHLKRTDNAHEEGGQVSLNHLRGSAGIAQLSDAVISLERDQQHKDLKKRNTTLVRVLKSRLTGSTGPAAALFFDKETFRLTEVPLQEYLEEDSGIVKVTEEDLYSNNVDFGEVLKP